ncbi:hypothetical protein [Azohydromonas caseinilytica]|uniref:Uncharacterized protein n=1 Tax=Azohydromonas caseinilytica TaxID=2728836 RepID=A0A848FCR7_9BURK|nr:hypothetical protein [Azohydromonas caseinilytica]NML16073.1 hypothetical protein [Azohydromonas caseinilytica]
MKLRLFLGMLTLSLLAACGGGGSDSPVVAGASTGGTPASSASSPAVSASAPSATASSPVAGAPVPSLYDRLVDAAEAKRKEVEALAVDGPCETDNQCGTLILEPTYIGPMSKAQEIDYSLVSSTALAASVAADQYNDLARQAVAVQPPDNSMCACTTWGLPTALRCISRKCVRLYGWDAMNLPSPTLE